MYIVIEGIKGVGKSSLLTAVGEEFQHNNLEFETICPTLRTKQINQFSTTLSYAELSNYHAEKTDWHSSIILGDRSIFTSLAVHLDDNLSVGSCWNKIRKLEHKIGIPDVVIQLVCDDYILMDRYQKRGRNYGLEEENIESIRRLTKNYERIKNWIARNSHAFLKKKNFLVHSRLNT